MVKKLMKFLPVLLILFMLCAQNGSKKTKITSVPDFTLTSLDGESITLSNLKGKVVLVDFWATWCPPCTASIPVLIDLYNNLNEKGLVVLGISIEEPTTLMKYREKAQISYPILLGNNDVAKAYNVQYIPTMVIIDKKGRISKRQVGFAPELKSKLVSYVDSLLNE